MQVTREMIVDLLPLYQSGEASADSRAAVEAFMRRDPSLVRLIADDSAGAEAIPPEASLERQAVSRTRAIIRRRSWVLAFAIFFTMLPFSFAFRGDEVTFFMLRDQPASALFCWLGAAALWVMHISLTRSLRTAGL